ncbi:MAG: energy transducer TonB [Bacteroidales bacterium]|nr:energy transducer TonB [Bacteroidales bacterium]
MKTLHSLAAFALLLFGTAFISNVSGANSPGFIAENGTRVSYITVSSAGDTVIVENHVKSIEEIVLLAEPVEDTDLITYLADNIHYPKSVLESGNEGYVKVFFTIEESGRLSNLLVLEGSNQELAGEVVKTLRKTKIQPVIQNGQPVRMNMILPVSFEIKE